MFYLQERDPGKCNVLFGILADYFEPSMAAI